MKQNERIANIYLIFLLPLGLAAVVWGFVGFPVEKVNGGMIAVSIITLFFSSALRIQLPRTKIHLTISDALVFLSLLLYGGEVSVILAALESAFTSYFLGTRTEKLKTKTILINITVAAVSSFTTAAIVTLIFGRAERVVQNGLNETFIWMLAAMGFSQFLVNSLLVAAIIAGRTKNTMWRVWNGYCLNAAAMFGSGAVMAGLSVVALQQINVFLFAAVIGFFALVFMTYRRYAEDIKATGAKAEQAERERAEQAEAHVRELEHYIKELEKSSRALGESRERFRHAAYHDALTGLPNRNKFLEEVEAILNQCKQNPEKRFAVLFLDLNRFKTLNESLGHSVGDWLITRVGTRLAEMKRENDLVGRFSGDEFAILLADVRETADVMHFAHEVSRQIAEPYSMEGREVFTSVSIGIAFGNVKYKKAEEVLRDADIAMYYAKEKQKAYVIFDREMHTRAVSLLELETDLRYAIERNEFDLYYQPIIDLEEMQLRGFEALVRWNHPQRGLVVPDNFIPLAEATGLIVPMTVLILRAAGRQLVEWKERSRRNQPLMVSVNLSAKHLSHPSLVDQITTVLEECGLEPPCLKLEITESAVMENPEAAIAVLNRIKATGVNLSIDDFGTGYSSLSYLHRFPVDTLKIDRSFVSTMEEGSENGEIVRTIIALAKVLKLNVIAEGIESIHQLHQLQILGCRYGQGFLFSRPLPAAEVEKFLADDRRWLTMLPVTAFGAATRNSEYTELILTQ